jgi:aspartokinase/homoserine dehydrogenase 1
MSGVTDLLMQASKEAAAGTAYHFTYTEVIAKYRSLLSGLAPEYRAQAEARFTVLAQELREVLDAIAAFRFCDVRMRDLLVGFGERIMCALMPYFLQSLGKESHDVDARTLIITDDRFGNARVLFDETNAKLAAWITAVKGIPVVTGYIASTREGMTTTLDRGGSDYTATIIGGGMNATRVEIWTDVNGAMTADPRVIPYAKVIERLTYEEAAEMAYFGAKVLHPLTLLPVAKKKIPVVIKNTFEPRAPGTTINSTSPIVKGAVKSIATRNGLILLNLEGGVFSGQVGTAGRVFTTLARAGVNIIMISQASSEQSICLIIQTDQKISAMDSLTQEFAKELYDGLLRVTAEDAVCVISVIGDGMKGAPGISGRVFSALGNAHINVLAIAQGSSERNISAVISETDRTTAVEVLHREFIKTPPPAQEIWV